MQFHSLNFLIFFPLVTLIYFIIPAKTKNLWLLFTSYYFYMCWNAKYALLLLTSTIITYISGLAMEKIRQIGNTKNSPTPPLKIIVAISVILNISILFYFKYINFALDILRIIFAKANLYLEVPVFDILLPVGISFYIFQALSYTMDVYREEICAEKNFFRYALFVSFFPQLVAGPIERSKNLLKQFAKPKNFEYSLVRSGLLTMLWGYFLKTVIADRCAVLVNTVYADYPSYYGFQLITANILFAFQIYCDFMAYSTIAKGAARVLGFDLMDNFHMPYFAVSIKDFWRRWHISLSSWLRDYLYIPLGGNRKGRFRKFFNLILTFLVSGLWHGASLTYVFWGLLHGIYQVIEDLTNPLWERFLKKINAKTESISWKILRVIKTFILVDFAWIFFRAESIKDAFYVIRQSLDLKNWGLILNGGLYELGLDERNMSILVLGMIILFLASVMKEKKVILVDWISRQTIIFRYILYWGALILIIFSLDITGQEFIYFQF